MMTRKIDRRRLLQAFGSAGMIVSAADFRAFAEEIDHPRNVDEKPKLKDNPFTLGVASGDPAPDGFVLWTRLALQPLDPFGGMERKPMAVRWEVSSDENFSTIVQNGASLAHPELGHSVHVEIAGLKPNRPYWYRFMIGGYQSMVGRSHTMPPVGAPLDRIRFAVAGCQHYEEGYYTAWRCIAEEPVDFVFHYGDYIYEGADRGPGMHKVNNRLVKIPRRHFGPEPYTLGDYRTRYAQYKSDPDLQAAHAAAPWWVSFDDHEVDNNWASDFDQDGTPPEFFALRRGAAMQAYYEHMPLRRSALPVGSHMQMYRSAQYGDLMKIFVLDTRQYRSDQVYGDKNATQGPDVYASNRTMMGDKQEAWLFDGLANAQSRWSLIAHQVMMLNLGCHPSPQAAEKLYSMDQWSGYLYSRRRLLQHIDEHCHGNVITVTGDAHRHYAGDLVQDNGNGKPISCEFLATSIASGGDGIGQDDYSTKALMAENPQLKAMTDRRGYVICDVQRDICRGDLKTIDVVTEKGGKLSTFASFVTERGHPGLQKA